ncbi:MAG: cyclodeaminase/cyclohydrolase family protein [Lachnospiraceae bacterium]|nr:cyclodeaminase/cyclohydrolase family protein [Lachnospiraceae bacterium]
MEYILNGGLTIDEFIEKLGSKEPVPGGGGAAALSAAIGINLCKMAVNYTVGKKKYADVEEQMQEILVKCDALTADFIGLIQKDADAFLPLSRAYSLPADTELEKAQKDAVLEVELENATRVPLEMMGKICEAIELAVTAAEKGSKLMVSDSACAVSTLESALRCASLNVFINTKLMKNKERAMAINDKAFKMLDSYCKRSDETFKSVYENMI